MRLPRVPELYMGRFLGEEVARRIRGGELAPVRMSPQEPVVAVPYELAEVAPSLLPGLLMGPQQPLAEWPQRASALIDRLDALGLHKVSEELAEISGRHDGKPLLLLDYENVLQGDKSLRVAFANWWEGETGQPVYELADGGSEVHHSGVHKQARFERPLPKEPKTTDRRFAHGEHIAEWPLSHEDVELWVQSRYWQYARTAPRNPHNYTHRFWGNEAMFLKVAQHIREHGDVETFGGVEYVYYEVSDRKLWSMGNSLGTTFLLNAKLHDPEDQALLSEEQTGKSREALGLDIPRPEVKETDKAADRSVGNGSTATAAESPPGTPELFGEVNEEKR